MFPLLLLAFVLVPIAELAVILRVGSFLGVWPTVILLVVDSLAGAVLVKREGRRAWESFRTALSEVRWPGDEVTQGALVLMGGALLLTPGFLTDAVGLLAVLPPTRRLASRLIRRRLTPEPFRDLIDRDRSDGPTPDVEVVSIERDGASGPGDPSRDDRGDRGPEGPGEPPSGGRGRHRSGHDEPSADDPSGRGTSGGRTS